MDDNNTFDAEEFKKPKLKSILINLLITLAVAAVAFYVTLPGDQHSFQGLLWICLSDSGCLHCAFPVDSGEKQLLSSAFCDSLYP